MSDVTAQAQAIVDAAFREANEQHHLDYDVHGEAILVRHIAEALSRDAAPRSGLTPPRPRDAPLSMPADRSALIERAIAADDAEVSGLGADPRTLERRSEGLYQAAEAYWHAATPANAQALFEALVLFRGNTPAPSNVGHDGPLPPQPDPPKAQRSSGPSGDVERVVRAAQDFVTAEWAFQAASLHSDEGTVGGMVVDQWNARKQALCEAVAALRGAPAASGEPIIDRGDNACPL